MKRKIISTEDSIFLQLLDQAEQSLYDVWWNYAEDRPSRSWITNTVLDMVETAFTDEDIPLPAKWKSQVRTYVREHRDEYDWDHYA